MSYAIVRAGEQLFRPVTELAGMSGVRVASLIDTGQGSVHLEIALVELAPGGVIPGHIHPFEESFFMLSGRALFALGETSYTLSRHDFGVAPIAAPHAWHNPFDEPVRWYQIRGPQPRPGSLMPASYAVQSVAIPTGGREVNEFDPTCRFVGRFADADMSPPGPLSMPGYHGHNIQDISIRMMVDEILGAQHHTLFVVEFAAHSGTPGSAARTHYHPFEEAYYFLSGKAIAFLDGDQHEIAAGDIVWCSTNGTHGYINQGDVPVRFIECQAPRPPASNAFLFPDDWYALSNGILKMDAKGYTRFTAEDYY